MDEINKQIKLMDLEQNLSREAFSVLPESHRGVSYKGEDGLFDGPPPLPGGLDLTEYFRRKDLLWDEYQEAIQDIPDVSRHLLSRSQYFTLTKARFEFKLGWAKLVLLKKEDFEDEKKDEY